MRELEDPRISANRQGRIAGGGSTPALLSRMNSPWHDHGRLRGCAPLFARQQRIETTRHSPTRFCDFVVHATVEKVAPAQAVALLLGSPEFQRR
jgi:hypothetical protein